MNLKRLYEARLCPVCGYQLNFTPWAVEMRTEKPCRCCGMHFGLDDRLLEDRESVYLAWRARWIEDGKRWWCNEPQPHDYDPDEQLKRVEAIG